MTGREELPSRQEANHRFGEEEDNNQIHDRR
jgi:hypothetical protein